MLQSAKLEDMKRPCTLLKCVFLRVSLVVCTQTVVNVLKSYSFRKYMKVRLQYLLLLTACLVYNCESKCVSSIQ